MGSEGVAGTIENSLIQITRSLGRYNMGRVTERALEGMVNLTHLAVIDCLGDSADTPCTTIGAIARRVGVDPSRASRMVRSALRAGYIQRVIAQEDARKTCVVLTAKGQKYSESIKLMRRRYFANLLKGWSREDRDEFSRLLAQFAGASREKKIEKRARKKIAEKPILGASVILHPILRQQAKRG